MSGGGNRQYLQRTLRDQFQRRLRPHENRFAPALRRPRGDTIQIEANAALQIATQYNVAYSTLTISSWSLSSWTDSNGNTWSSSTPIPGGVSDFAAGAGDGGFSPPPPGGNASIPGGVVVPAAPKASPPSAQPSARSARPRRTACPIPDRKVWSARSSCTCWFSTPRRTRKPSSRCSIPPPSASATTKQPPSETRKKNHHEHRAANPCQLDRPPPRPSR